MSNPLITVLSALYGAPGTQVVDITQQTQVLFDQQYTGNPGISWFTLSSISPQLFGIPDPAPNQVKTYSVVYSLGATSGTALMRGGQDGDTLVLTVLPLSTITIVRATYATNTMGLDVTSKLAAYVADPGNGSQLTVGSQPFFNALTGGSDPAPNVLKFFSAIYLEGQTQQDVCGFDGQTITFA